MIYYSSQLLRKSIARSIYYIWNSIAVYTVTPIFAENTQKSTESSLVDVQISEIKAQELDFFIQKALENNHQYKASQAQSLQAKKLQESETIIVEDPMFSIGLLNVPLNSFPAIDSSMMSGVGFMLSQKIAMPGESESRNQMAGSEYKARGEAKKDLELGLAYRVRLVYYELNYLYHKDSLLKESQESLNGIVSVARAMVSVNKMNSAQLLKLEANLSQLESQIKSTSAMIYKAQSLLEELTLVKAPFYFGKKMYASQIAPDEIQLPQKFEASSHPRYQIAKAIVDKSSAKKNNEIAKYFPFLTLSAEYMIKDQISGQSNTGEDMVSFRITAPLPLFFPIKQGKRVQAAEEGIKEANENLAQTEISLKTKWEGEYQMAVRLLEVYTRYHNDTLPRFFASYKAMLGSLSSSRVTLLDVLDSYRDYLEASIKEAESYRDLQKSIAMLKYLEASE